ncbi:MAG: HDOD domain-containing protein, partial [Rhodoferax sp.]|nr:HDOD domain-containing protein [Rhodoferax sp.]
LGATQAEGEAAFIGALFQNLGRMLAQFYFPEEAASIRGLVNATHDPVSEEVASKRVLGLSFEALGLGVSKAWGLPESIQRCIVKPAGEPPMHPAKDPHSNLRWGVRAANEMADAMLHADAAVVDVRLAQVGRRYARSLGLSVDQMQHATVAAREKLTELAQAMEITVQPDSLAANLLSPTSYPAPEPDAQPSAYGETLRANELRATEPAESAAAAPVEPLDGPVKTVAASDQVAQTLTAGIQDITNAMVEDFKLSDILRMILEAMFRALDFQRVVFCLRDPNIDTLTGRFGLGAGVEGVVKTFSVYLGPSKVPDLFATICSKGADTLISDASDPRIAERLPAWYRQTYHAPTFLILPLQLKGKPFGLIYADKADKSGLVVGERELSLLRTLRNQAVMAFKQSS